MGPSITTPTPDEDDAEPGEPTVSKRTLDDTIPLELKTYTVDQLAVMLHRSVKSIKVDVTRNPGSLPPVFRVPGSRKIVFRHVDLQAWMDDLSYQAERRRRAEAEALRPSPWRPGRRLSR